MSADVAAICAGLTKAQREAVLGARHREERSAWHPAGWHFNADRRVRFNLAKKRLIHDYVPSFSRLTPLGLSVRSALQQNDEG